MQSVLPALAKASTTLTQFWRSLLSIAQPSLDKHGGELLPQPEVQLNQPNGDLLKFFDVVDALDVVNNLDLFKLSSQFPAVHGESTDNLSRIGTLRIADMACWYPSPWFPPANRDQPESPHQAAIAKTEEPKPRRRRTPKPDSES